MKCILCGADLVNGVCPNLAQHIKPMCLNCIYKSNNEKGEDICDNEENKQDAKEKILASVPAGYELSSFELKALPLKDCTKKCKKWAINDELVGNTIKEMF